MTSLRRSLVCRGTRVDESGFVCEYGGLGAVVEVELFADACDMGERSVFADEGDLGDLCVPEQGRRKARRAGVFAPRGEWGTPLRAVRPTSSD